METITAVLSMMHTVLDQYGALVIVLATFLLGENAALATFALSAQGYIHPLKAIVFVFIGSMLADTFWFLITECVLKKQYKKYIDAKLKKGDEKMLARLVDNHFFIVLIFIKFLVGVRLFLTIYIILKNKVPIHKLAILNAIGTTLFISVIFPMGWLFGKGFSSMMLAGNWFIKVLSILVFMVLFVNFLSKVVMFLIGKYLEPSNPK